MADWCEGILGLPSPVLLDGGLEGLCGQVGCGAWVRDTVNDKNMHTLYEPSLVRSLSKGHTHSRKLTWNLLSPLPLLRAAAIWCFSRLSRDTPAMVGPESLPLLHWPLSQHTSLSWPQSHPHGVQWVSPAPLFSHMGREPSCPCFSNTPREWDKVPRTYFLYNLPYSI